MVLAICRRLLRDSTEAEDAAQQTFLSAQRALQNGSQPREPAAWLATIARNECVARTRARMREPLLTDVEPVPSGADAHSEAVRRENVEHLREAIGSLPDQQREAILLRELRGLSYDEVAASLALSPSAVESLLFRARKGLQLRLRNAWAALSPVGWLATARELSAQVVAGGDPGVGPAAAKAVVIGLGTAVIAGGALVGPNALHRGRPHAARVAAAAPGATTTTHRTTPAPAAVAAPDRAPAPPVAPSEQPTAAVRRAVSRLPAERTRAADTEDRAASPESSSRAAGAPAAGEDSGSRSDTSSGRSDTSSGTGSEAGTVSGGEPGDHQAAADSQTERPSTESTANATGTFAVPPAPHELERSDSGSTGGGEHERGD